MFTETKLCAWEYVPTTFELKRFVIELTGTATNDDFLNASWQDKYFYKVGEKTLAWEHPFEIEPANFDCVDFVVDITGVKNSHISFQFQITEDSFDIVEIDDEKQVAVDGNFPIYSWRVEAEE